MTTATARHGLPTFLPLALATVLMSGFSDPSLPEGHPEGGPLDVVATPGSLGDLPTRHLAAKATANLTRFEFVPFVFVADELSSSELYISPVRTDVERITLELADLAYGPRAPFGVGLLQLFDDGVDPDQTAGDNVFTATVTLQDPPMIAGRLMDNTNVYEIPLTFDYLDGSSDVLVEEVDVFTGHVASRRFVSKNQVAPGVFFTDDVVNLVDPSLLSPYPTRTPNERTVSNRFFDHFADDFDWLIVYNVYNSAGMTAGYFVHTRNQVEGIGLPIFDHGAQWGSASRLRGAIQAFNGSAGVVTHEVMHTWGVFGFDALGVAGRPHWQAVATGGATRLILQGSSAITGFTPLGSGLFEGCRVRADPVAGIELYLMGLVPSSEIGTYTFVKNAQEVSSYNKCSTYQGDGLETLDEARVLSHFGPRNPPYPDQSRFHGAVVVVSDRELTDPELDFVSQEFESHAQSFYQTFEGRASFCYELSPAGSYTLEIERAGDGNGVVTSDPPGINCGSNCTYKYGCGTGVTLQATPDPGSAFVEWQGDPDCLDGALGMNANNLCRAVFERQRFTLSVNRWGSGQGTVTSQPAGIDCGQDCEERYVAGTAVVLTATPEQGSLFDGWSGDADCSDGTVTLDADRACWARFDPIPTYRLTVSLSGTGSGTVSSTPAGIDCGNDCSEEYLSGTTVVLTATPQPGSHFTGWSGDADCADGTVTLDADRVCRARFYPIPDNRLTVSRIGTGTGRVTSSPPGIDCGDDCTETYPPGTTVVLTATPQPGSELAGWTGNADCSDGTVTLDENMTCSARFERQFFTLTVSIPDIAYGRVTSQPDGIDCGTRCSKTYPGGTSVTLQATPKSWIEFTGWGGDADCHDGVVVILTPITCEARFEIRPALVLQIPSYNGGSSDFDCDRCNFPWAMQVDDLVLDVGATIARFEIWGGYTGGPATEDHFTIEIYSDQGGLPGGTPLYSVSDVSPVSRTPTGRSLYLETEEIHFVFELGSGVWLPPGVYWLAVAADTTDESDDVDFLWGLGNLDTTRGRPGHALKQRSAGDPWAATSSDLALLIPALSEPTLFLDGFESGDTSRWTSVSP